MKLKEAYSHWFDHKKRLVKESSLSTYANLYRKIIASEFADHDIADMDKKAIMSFLYKLLDSGLSQKYCSDVLIVIKMILRHACDELDEKISDTSWKASWPSRNCAPEKHKLEVYSMQEYRKILDYIFEHPSPRNLGILLTMCSGMRIGEVCALQFRDIDMNEKTIHVCKTIERIWSMDNGKSKVVIGLPKTASSDRHIPIQKDVWKVLIAFSKTCKPDYYVCSCSESPIEPRTFRNYYRSLILEKVKLPRCLKFHGLRHTFASMMIANKVDVKTVSSLLGHSDVSTTLNVYVHPSSETKKRAINAGLGKLF